MLALARLSRPAVSTVCASTSKFGVQIIAVRNCAAFRGRPGVLPWQRAKDAIHFYLVGLVIIPFGFAVVVTNIVYGPCELNDYPEEGYTPRYWQFERTPMRQWCAKISNSDMSYYERSLGYHYWIQQRAYFINLQDRIRHLMNERLDYKGYGYLPMKQRWVEHSAYIQENQKQQVLSARYNLNV